VLKTFIENVLLEMKYCGNFRGRKGIAEIYKRKLVKFIDLTLCYFLSYHVLKQHEPSVTVLVKKYDFDTDIVLNS
jgi:hypothetical protein